MCHYPVAQHLSVSLSVSFCLENVSQALAGLKHVRSFVSNKVALAIFNSLIQPLLDYCGIVLDNRSAAQASRLQKLKNRTGRVIALNGYNTRSCDIKKELSWRMLHETRNQHKVILV